MGAGIITEPLSRVFHGVVGDKHAVPSDALAEVSRLREALAVLVDATEAADAVADEAALTNPHNINRIQPVLAAKQRGWIGTPESRALEQLFKENPDWRKTLKTACEAKLAIIESETREIEKSVRQELSDGFSEDQIESHPRLMRIRRELGKWRTLVADCDTEKDSELWRRCIRNF